MILAAQNICLDVGLECVIADDDSCDSITCGEDHRWTKPVAVSCP